MSDDKGKPTGLSSGSGRTGDIRSQRATPANRCLLRALHDAYEAAQEVDGERGTKDCTADDAVGLLARVQMEVYGPEEHGEGADR
jgi:hypothetical protein